MSDLFETPLLKMAQNDVRTIILTDVMSMTFR